jgi:hypothetical protein
MQAHSYSGESLVAFAMLAFVDGTQTCSADESHAPPQGSSAQAVSFSFKVVSLHKIVVVLVMRDNGANVGGVGAAMMLCTLQLRQAHRVSSTTCGHQSVVDDASLRLSKV